MSGFSRLASETSFSARACVRPAGVPQRGHHQHLCARRPVGRRPGPRVHHRARREFHAGLAIASHVSHHRPRRVRGDLRARTTRHGLHHLRHEPSQPRAVTQGVRLTDLLRLSGGRRPECPTGDGHAFVSGLAARGQPTASTQDRLARKPAGCAYRESPGHASAAACIRGTCGHNPTGGL